MLGNLPPSMYALTDIQASTENVLFGTADPNESREPVPGERLDFLYQDHRPAFLNAGGSAGLNGQGLGNAFLSHIS